MKIEKFKWWHCVIIYLVANTISLIPAGYNGDEAFYNNFSRPQVAPPDWLFAPMWFFLNVTSLIALYIIVNLPKEVQGRKSIIILESFGWVLYAIFTLLYFGLKSPVLGAVDTVLGLLVVVSSLIQSFTVSKKAFWLIFPRLLWLLLATYVSVWVAINNTDLFFN